MLSRSKPLHQQVQEAIRARILNGELAPGARLESTSALAAMFGASIFTVQTALARLAKEGLIVRSPRRPTFIAKNVQRVCSVAIYFCRPIAGRDMAFYQTLCGELQRKLAGRRMETVVWVDDRPEAEQSGILAGIKRALEQGEIQAIIAPLVNESSLEWLEEAGVPFSAIRHDSSVPNPVLFGDRRNVLKDALQCLHAQGCRKIGLISHDFQTVEGTFGQDVQHLFLEVARGLGLEVCDEWVRCAEPSQHSPDRHGYVQFSRLWNSSPRPDAILAYPETVARGVVAAVLERQVRVPQELRLALHVNNLAPYHFPFVQIVTDVDRIVESLIEVVVRKINGAEPSQIPLADALLQGAVRDTPPVFESKMKSDRTII